MDAGMFHKGRRTIQQLPILSRKGHNAILKARYLEDIVTALGEWSCTRVVLVHSKTLDSSTNVIDDLKRKLDGLVVAIKSGVGAHSPYNDILDITKLLHEKEADCLISIGSSSYSDACKIARLMHTTLPPERLTTEAMESLVNQEQGSATKLSDPTVKLILIPTSLSASEWNHISSATNPHTRKKQHFGIESAAPDLILLDSEVASTAPQILWLSSGMRAVDHCIETMCNEECTEDASQQMEDALATLIKGLKEYKAGGKDGNRQELLQGVSECQTGSRQAMLGLLLRKIPMGASHAIGHQLGSLCGIMYGITSCIMLGPVLRYTQKKSRYQAAAQEKVLKTFNRGLGWDEKSAADAVERFVRMLELPGSLEEVGILDREVLEIVAEKTMSDVWGGGKRQVDSMEEVMSILEMARYQNLSNGYV